MQVKSIDFKTFLYKPNLQKSTNSHKSISDLNLTENRLSFFGIPSVAFSSQLISKKSAYSFTGNLRTQEHKDEIAKIRTATKASVDKKHYIERNQIPELVNKFADKLIALDNSQINCIGIQQLIESVIPEDVVKVKGLSELTKEKLTNVLACYSSNVSGEKALYINFKVDLNDINAKAKVVKAIVHEFTHALQDHTNDNLSKLHPVAVQRGVLHTLNQKFFDLEDKLLIFFTNIKLSSPVKQITDTSSEELLKLSKSTRESLDNDYQELLFPFVVNRLCPDRSLTLEFYANELKDEAQAYKLALNAYKKVINDVQFYNYDLFQTLFEDLSNYIQRRSDYKPEFIEKDHPNYDKLTDISIDLEFEFGKNTIIKEFNKLSSTRTDKKGKPEDLNIFEFFDKFDRASLNKLYDRLIEDTLKKHNVDSTNEIKLKLTDNLNTVAQKVEKYIRNLKKEYQLEDEIIKADYIPLIYKDFANYIKEN